MTDLSQIERLELSKAARRLPFILTCPVGSANIATVEGMRRFWLAYGDHADKEYAKLQGELTEARRAAVTLRGLRQAIGNVASTLEALDARRDAVLGDATIRDQRVMVGHDPDTDTDFLVTLFPDGTAEVATRPGNGERWITWGTPVALSEDDVT